MKTKVILFGLFTITLFSLGTTITLLFNSGPTEASLISYFFLSLFVTLFGLFFFSLLLWNFLKNRGVPAWGSTLTNGRYSLLAAGFLTLALVLRSYKVWNIATGLVLVVVFVVLDLLWRRRFNWKKL